MALAEVIRSITSAPNLPQRALQTKTKHFATRVVASGCSRWRYSSSGPSAIAASCSRSASTWFSQ